MKHTLKNRIISGFVALLLILTTTLPSGIVFGENEQADVLAVQEDTQATDETDANDDNEEGMRASDSQTGDDETAAESSDDTSEGEKITGYDADSNAMDSDVNTSGTESEENNSQTNDSTENASNGKTSANDNNSETNIADDTELEHQNIEICPDETDPEKTVVLDGLMPKEATAEVVDVTEQSETENVIAAYDITIVDGEEEYQPGEENPINVEITDPRITDGSNLQIWHITDDGEREEITDFTVEDGKVCFDAAGFSVYEIVQGPTPYSFVPEYADEADKLTDSDSAKKGFFLSIIADNKEQFITNTVNTNGALTEVGSIADADRWYFNKLENGHFNIYTYVGEDIMYLTYNDVSAALDSTNGAEFIISKDSGSLRFQLVDNGKYLQHSNKAKGVRYHQDNNSNGIIKSLFASSVTLPKDPYSLDGKTYGLMYYTGGNVTGKAMMAEVTNGKLASQNVLTKDDPFSFQENSLFVPKDSDMSMWTFHSEKEDYYTISVVSGGETKYLKINGGISLVDKSDASLVKVTPGTDDNAGKIRLSVDNKVIKFSSSSFQSASLSLDSSVWLNLTTKSSFSEDDFVVYSAKKVGVSDEVNVKNGAQVIVYTRIWDNNKKTYRFYAVDRDGSLIPCYERGDNIMWVGSQINTLLWNFIEYYYEGTTTPNYYYDLYNPYSDKYLAPQIGGGQVLSGNSIGINLPGRRDGEYYTDILAWDDPYYAYASLKNDLTNGKLASSNRSGAETYYFAMINPEDVLTPVKTIDNSKYGITMKMVDFDNKKQQDDVIGGDTEFHESNQTTGLLSSNLADNNQYPMTANNKSLSELFGDAKSVNHLFIESIYNASGYFEYDSAQNYATLKDKKEGDFTVYKELGTMNTRGNVTDKHGQFMPYNDIQPGVYSTINPENLYDVLKKELPETDPRKYEKLHLVGNANNKDATNWNFGMELNAEFTQTASGKDAWGHDVIFEFTGDDDFWLYVDNELVIDLGGVHSALAGKVNFSTGEVYVNGTTKTLRQIFRENYEDRYKKKYISEHEGATEADAEAALAADIDAENTYLAQFFDGDETIFKDYSSHKMKIFYMERGQGASNLHMRFNLSYVTPGSVMLSKDVTGTEALTDSMDFSLVEYPYQIWYKVSAEDEPKLLRNDSAHVNVTYQNSTQKVDYRERYTPPKATDYYESVYFLSPDKVAEIKFPENTYQYKIVECGVNTEVYDGVSVPGVDSETMSSTQTPGNINRFSFEIPWTTVEARKVVTFENHVNPEGLRTLSIDKKLLDEEGNELTADQDSTTFSFRLYLTNGSDDQLQLVNLYKYRVRDPQKKLCRWDATEQKFVSIGKANYGDLTDTEKESVTFETSINGQISKIPAGFTVDVPGLPVGTLFKVEERESDIPLGYSLKEYERDGSSYQIADGDTINSGRVRANEAPSMTVVNKRGWEIKANKVWSDKDYTSSHGSIYTAVYVGDSMSPLSNTVRQIRHPDTSVRYFFDSLENGKAFSDYKVYEVELTNPVFDADGNLVSYDAVKKLVGGDLTTISAVAKGHSASNEFGYSVDYLQGTPTSTATGADPAGNVRTDTVTNTRSGGIVITLFDMSTRYSTQKIRLPEGMFTLERYDSESDSFVEEGTYVSDAYGRVTILYEFAYDTRYRITQTASPKGYIGLPEPVTFKVTRNGANDTITVEGNEEIWRDGYSADKTSGDNLVAYVDLYNKPYSIEVYKYDGELQLPEAHFALYKGRVGGKGTIVKDYVPMTGYGDLVTGNNGIISEINHELAAGTYYLTETAPPEGYIGLSNDVVFEISSMGGIQLVSAPVGSGVQIVSTETEETIKYTLMIPNVKVGAGDASLTITKTVTGSMGNKTKNFTFTFTKTGAAATDEFTWSKNGVEQTTKLHSGGTFTMSHDDEVVITVPKDAEVTITEANEGYDTTFKLGNADADEVATKTFTVSDDITLAVTNTLNAAIPTGVWMSFGTLLLLGGLCLVGILCMIITGRKRRTEAFLERMRERRN